MEVEITLKNYRCFSDSSPAQFRIRDGFVAFVGVNNAGKSSILKFFYEFRQLLSELASFNPQHYIAPFSFGLPFVKDGFEIFCNQNNRDITIDLEFTDLSSFSNPTNLTVPKEISIQISRANLQATASLFLRNQPTVPIRPFTLLGNDILGVNGEQTAFYGSAAAVFISLRNAMYIGPFRNTLGTMNGQTYYDIQIGIEFIATWRNYRNGDVKAQNEIALGLTREIQEIFGFGSLSIEPSASNNDLKVFIDNRSYSLSELGSGLAQFIIILFNAAIKNPDFILIDEPELNLHPKLQMKFLNTLKSYAQKSVLFATHNYGLARSSTDLIYSVRVRNNGEREIGRIEQLNNLSMLLGEMSFSSYHELGFSKILLVEGTHDVPTIQKLLQKLQMDQEVILIPLGGSTLINSTTKPHLHELRRITDKIAVLIDSEKSHEDKPLEEHREGFVRVCRELEIPCHVLERRAIENYFTERAIQSVDNLENCRALEPYEKLSDLNPRWSKSDNWKIASAMNIDELEDTDLFQFLKSLRIILGRE